MDTKISAILLAAGESRRMGRPKLLLPWGKTTVLGQVISTFAAGLGSFSAEEVPPFGWEIIVVTGGSRQQVEQVVEGWTQKGPIRVIYNPAHTRSEMLGSLQTGLSALGPAVSAAMIGLGDQPQVRPETIRSLCRAYARSKAPLIVPTIHQHRGHPWLVERSLWAELLALPSDATPRQFLHEHAEETVYIQADESILQDLDTPEDYQRLQP